MRENWVVGGAGWQLSCQPARRLPIGANPERVGNPLQDDILPHKQELSKLRAGGVVQDQDFHAAVGCAAGFCVVRA